MKTIYLDHAAATPLDPAVNIVMKPYLTERFYNPSAVYLAARDVAKDLTAARSQVAQTIGSRPVEVTFTAGGTEANNLAISGVLRKYTGSKVVVSAIEHDSVLRTAEQYDHAVAPVTERGVVGINHLRGLVDDATVLVSVMYANNEIGTIQPITDVARLVGDIRADRKRRGITLPIFVHTDAAQAGNYLDIHVSRLGVDMMTLNGGKIYGPKQSGALYVRAGIQLEPLIYGGGQEHGLRSGTENVAGAIGFAKALQMAQETRHEETKRLKELQEYFFHRIAASIPSATINGWLKKRLPNNVHITIPGQDNERLLFGLDTEGIQAAAGSACSASSETPSHVLLACAVSEAAARSSLRFTMGRSTTKADIDKTARALIKLLV